jgi:hypothetical protein
LRRRTFWICSSRSWDKSNSEDGDPDFCFIFSWDRT